MTWVNMDIRYENTKIEFPLHYAMGVASFRYLGKDKWQKVFDLIKEKKIKEVADLFEVLLEFHGYDKPNICGIDLDLHLKAWNIFFVHPKLAVKPEGQSCEKIWLYKEDNSKC